MSTSTALSALGFAAALASAAASGTAGAGLHHPALDLSGALGEGFLLADSADPLPRAFRGQQAALPRTGFLRIETFLGPGCDTDPRSIPLLSSAHALDTCSPGMGKHVPISSSPTRFHCEGEDCVAQQFKGKGCSGDVDGGLQHFTADAECRKGNTHMPVPDLIWYKAWKVSTKEEATRGMPSPLRHMYAGDGCAGEPIGYMPMGGCQSSPSDSPYSSTRVTCGKDHKSLVGEGWAKDSTCSGTPTTTAVQHEPNGQLDKCLNGPFGGSIKLVCDAVPEDTPASAADDGDWLSTFLKALRVETPAKCDGKMQACQWTHTVGKWHGKDSCCNHLCKCSTGVIGHVCCKGAEDAGKVYTAEEYEAFQ
jgi:hypothetical protein